MHRQLIPGLRTRDSKCTGAKVRDRAGDNKVATSGGSESLSATGGCDWSTDVGDVRRCQSMQRLVCQQTQLELDALWDGKSMKAVPQRMLDMILLKVVLYLRMFMRMTESIYFRLKPIVHMTQVSM